MNDKHIPLNGSGVINKIHAALRGQESYSPPERNELDPIQEALAGLPSDAPDGTGGSTKSEPVEPTRSARATDPSQGSGARSSRTPRDPLAEALRSIGRGGSRRRF